MPRRRRDPPPPSLRDAERRFLADYRPEELRRLARACEAEAGAREDRAAGRWRRAGLLRVTHQQVVVGRPYDWQAGGRGDGVHVTGHLVAEDGRWRYVWEYARELDGEGQLSVLNDASYGQCGRYLLDASRTERQVGLYPDRPWLVGVVDSFGKIGWRRRPPPAEWRELQRRVEQAFHDHTGLPLRAV